MKDIVPSGLRTRMIKCSCGSGQRPHAIHDARGIFVAYVCDKCEATRRAGYRPEIFTDPNYDTGGEPVEEE